MPMPIGDSHRKIHSKMSRKQEREVLLRLITSGVSQMSGLDTRTPCELFFERALAKNEASFS